MAAKKKGKSLGKKAMKKTKGGALNAYQKLDIIPGPHVVPTESLSLNYKKLQ